MCCSIFPLRTISPHPLMGQYWTTPGHCRVCDGRRYLDENVYLHYYLVIIPCKTGFPLYDNQMCYCGIFVLVSCVFCKITELDNKMQLVSAPEFDTPYIRWEQHRSFCVSRSLFSYTELNKIGAKQILFVFKLIQPHVSDDYETTCCRFFKLRTPVRIYCNKKSNISPFNNVATIQGAVAFLETAVWSSVFFKVGVFAFFPANTSNFPHGTRTLVGWLGSALYCLVALKTDHVNLLALFNMLFSRVELHLVLAGKTVSLDSCEQLRHKDIPAKLLHYMAAQRARNWPWRSFKLVDAFTAKTYDRMA